MLENTVSNINSLTANSSEQSAIAIVYDAFENKIPDRGLFWSFNHGKDAMEFFANPQNEYGAMVALQEMPLPTDLRKFTALMMLKFYYIAKYNQAYQTPAADAVNCGVIKTLISGIDNEIENVDKLFLSEKDATDHNYRLEVLQGLQTKFNSLYANLNCDISIYQQQQQAQVDTITSVAQGTTTTQTSYTNYIIYAIAVIVIIAVFAKILKKQ